ncbi:MAG: TrmH family RNA methyltransferase [Chloroflexota bacterium]
MITSAHNSKIQEVRRLLSQPKARREARAFVVEGVRLVAEAFQSNWALRVALWSDDLSRAGHDLLARIQAAGVVCEQVDRAVLRATSDTQTPQGILAVAEVQSLPLPEPLDFLLLLDNLRDPGNLGTILRTASAAGVQAVLLSPGSADPYNPKVVRSAMGAHFHLPVRPLGWPAIFEKLAGIPVYAADAAGERPYTQADFRKPVAIVIGSEAEGVGAEAQQLAQQRLSIPMPGYAESLNAAVAAALLMFEVVKQRGPLQEGEQKTERRE